jgi:RND family efflux transporter MFP subunit
MAAWRPAAPANRRRSLEKPMPDKNPDGHSAAEPGRDEMLRYRAPKDLKRWGRIAAIAAIAIAVVGVGLRLWHDHETAQWTDEQAIPTVQVLKLKGAKSGSVINLPGQVQPFADAPIYAQVSGTVLKWFVDIGAPVKKGQILAQIDPRPYQAALAQARGQLARDAATLANARTDLGRYQTLSAQNAISAQQLSSQQASVASTSGIVEADRGALQQANINLGFTRIVAPFDGTVTSRAVDVGQLVTEGAPGQTPLFTVSDQSRLRVYVHVPQIYAGAVRPGMAASFTVPEYPGRVFTTTLAASSGAVASATGTQLLQFQIDNRDGAIKPGDYADVKFTVPPGAGGIRLPVTALIFRDQGLMVATVDASNHVRMKLITVRQDLGSAVIVGSGISLDDRVIDNPSDSLQAGDHVKVAGG